MMPTTPAERTAIYLSDFADEMMPDSLEDWAALLANDPDTYWHREDVDTLAYDGQEFAANCITYRYIPAQRQPDGTYQITPSEDGWAIHAAAYFEGSGWQPGMLISRSDELVKKLRQESRGPTPDEDREDEIRQAALMLNDCGDQPTEYLVHRKLLEQSAIVTYRTNPSRCEIRFT